MAAGGTLGEGATGPTRLDAIDGGFLLVTLALLFWLPQLIFGIRLDVDGAGDAQRIFSGLIAKSASASTAIYILLAHFSGGPLREVSIGPLFAGLIGLVLLITPFYKALVRACCSRGIGGIASFDTYRQDWAKAVMELRKAVSQAPGRRVAQNEKAITSAGTTGEASEATG
jgi:hypothetical protein